MQRILIVDDESEMRLALRSSLAKAGYNVVTADDGRAAQIAFKAHEFDLVIADFQMPELNGLELLKWVKSQKNVPFILMTGFSYILETQEAFKAGADGFLTKPLAMTELLESIRKILEPLSAKTSGRPPTDLFFQIPIEDFMKDGGVPVNIYLKLSDQKFIRVAHKGDLLPVGRAMTYKTRGVNYLHTKKDDFAGLVGLELSPGAENVGAPSATREQKAEFIERSQQLVSTKVPVGEMDAAAAVYAKDCLNLHLSLITESQNLFPLLQSINQHDDWYYPHNLGVSLYSIMMGRKLGWLEPAMLFKLVSLGVFHGLMKKTDFRMSPAERRDKLRELPADVLDVLCEKGTEVLAGETPSSQSALVRPLTQIVGTAEVFSRYAMDSATSQRIPAKQAVQNLKSQHQNQVDIDALGALQSILI